MKRALAGVFLAALAVSLGPTREGTARSNPEAGAGAPAALAPAPPPAPPPPARLLIPKLGVNAAVEVRGVGADGVSEAPADPNDVAWYDFSDPPGSHGIALFAGHRDWWGVGPTVFYKLDSLRPGDRIRVLSRDGSTRAYTVVQGFLVDPDSKASDLLTGTPGSIVLYTCDGAFDPLKGEYTRRFVVKADPVQD